MHDADVPVAGADATQAPSRRGLIEALTAHTQDTIGIVDRRGRIREIYGSFAAIGGWTREQVIGRSVARFIHPLDAALALGRFALNVADPDRGGRYSLEVRAALADGGWRRVEVLVANRLADPAIRGLVITVRDVEGRRAAESRLTASEDRFRAMADLARDLITVVGADGTISYQSASVEPMLGYTIAERMGRSAFDTIHPDDVAAATAAFRRMLADPGATQLHELELRARRRDGSWCWLHVVGVNLLEHDAVRGIVINSRDVTARKQAEAALAASQARLDAALWGARAGFWSFDVTRDAATMSPQFFEITGIDPAEWHAERHPWQRRIHPQDRSQVSAAYAAHAAGHTDTVEVEYRMLTPAGWLWVGDRGRVVERDGAGHPQLIAGTTSDISARKQLEQAIVDTANREQQRMSQELHDGLGQELTGIALLLKSIATRLRRTPAGSDVTADIELAVDYVSNTIRDARALARGLHPVRADHGGIIAALGALAAKSSVTDELAVELDGGGWPGLDLGDDAGAHVYRIAQEAITNAIRHGGATRVRMSLTAGRETFTFRVHDNGAGITAAARQAPGLGLRTMTYRSQMIGGTLRVSAAAGGGTEVVLTAPLGGLGVR